MKSEKFFCARCNKIFIAPRFYFEKHGLANPPFERIAVCPICCGDDFIKYNTMIEKYEIAEKIMLALMHFNKYISAIKDIFGIGIRNEDLFCGIEVIAESIYEMFDFLDIGMQKKILNVESEKELEEILTYLRGGI